ncbi:lipase 1 [Actinoplanes sp. OR16]|uniref:SGNH/GDSL hydrolase family protein n=1 Tax=Actinoplanes sp. OR16 TaxID=946334 RepID=UPI000F721182|nr:SGNH/GDSL hydrolase family protein [Actinoplanes sp. OR16]BBH67353.1 lipase 1 [Actinoplanes sp. OR16]
MSKPAWTVGLVALSLLISGCSAEKAEEKSDKAAEIVAANDYVALGDSYAAGLGAGDYADSSCLVSKDKSYPQQWIDEKADLGATLNNACSGAVINTVATRQLTALTEKTGWVTLTVGGNDVGFVAGLQQCLLGNDQTCAQSVTNATGTMENTLPGSLDDLYTKIRTAAPNAKVYVVGYPHLVADPGSGTKCDLNDARRKTLNEASDTLSEVIAAAVTKHPGFTYVDGRIIFAGHEACTKDPWINAVADNVSESFHPNADGYAAYAKALLTVTR